MKNLQLNKENTQ